MKKTGVALGSNVGDRLRNLREARRAIALLPGVASPVSASAVYETEPIDCEPGANQFLNAVIQFDYKGDPLELLRELKAIETQLGRPEQRPRNVSRTIDVDLLYLGDLRLTDKELKLPHPRMHLRRFVLAPVADIAPDLILPGQTKTIRELLDSLDEPAKVQQLTRDWS